MLCIYFLDLNCGSEVKTSASNAGDPGSIPGLGRSPGEGNGNPLQYSCLENPVDGGSLVGQSPQGRKESDTTERLHFHFQRYFYRKRSFSRVIIIILWPKNRWKQIIKPFFFFFNVMFHCVLRDSCFYFYLFFNFSGCTPWHVGSLFPIQESKPCPLHWRCRVLNRKVPIKLFKRYIFCGW